MITRESPLAPVCATAAAFLLFDDFLLGFGGTWWAMLMFAWLPAVSTLARDTMFAVIMIVLNGMVGLSLLLGGLRYHEQTYNLQGANAFLAVIVPLAALGLVLPNYTVSSPGPTFSTPQATFLIVMSLGLYGVFLAIQNLRHRDYFIAP